MRVESPHQNVINYNAGGKQDRLLLGIVMMVIGESIFVMMGATVKYITNELPLLEVLFFRNLFALIFIIPFVYRVGFAKLRTAHLGLHFTRALFGVLAMMCMFYAFASLRLSEAVLLKATSPIFLSFIAWVLLRERLNIVTWFAIALAFFGVALIALFDDPEFGRAVSNTGFDASWGFVAGFFAALLGAAAKIQVRRLGRTEPGAVIVFYFALFASILSLPAALWVWQSVSFAQWPWVALIALLATLGQLCLTKAYSIAKAGKIGLYSYLSMPIAGLLGWVLWDEQISRPLMIGAGIVIAAAALSLYSNREPALSRSRST